MTKVRRDAGSAPRHVRSHSILLQTKSEQARKCETQRVWKRVASEVPFWSHEITQPDTHVHLQHLWKDGGDGWQTQPHESSRGQSCVQSLPQRGFAWTAQEAHGFTQTRRWKKDACKLRKNYSDSGNGEAQASLVQKVERRIYIPVTNR
jgi:hypothetical protein